MSMQKNIVDEVFPETLKILSDLIKFQTISGSPNLKLIEYCEDKLKKLDAVSFKTINESTQQANLFSTISGKKKIKRCWRYIIRPHGCCSGFTKRMVVRSIFS